jgi:hypothetical protein
MKATERIARLEQFLAEHTEVVICPPVWAAYPEHECAPLNGVSVICDFCGAYPLSLWPEAMARYNKPASAPSKPGPQGRRGARTGCWGGPLCCLRPADVLAHGLDDGRVHALAALLGDAAKLEGQLGRQAERQQSVETQLVALGLLTRTLRPAAGHQAASVSTSSSTGIRVATRYSSASDHGAHIALGDPTRCQVGADTSPGRTRAPRLRHVRRRRNGYPPR